MSWTRNISRWHGPPSHKVLLQVGKQWNEREGERWYIIPSDVMMKAYLKLSTRWWRKNAVSTFASSAPGQSRGPPPKGANFLPVPWPWHTHHHISCTRTRPLPFFFYFLFLCSQAPTSFANQILLSSDTSKNLRGSQDSLGGYILKSSILPVHLWKLNRSYILTMPPSCVINKSYTPISYVHCEIDGY